MWRQQDPQTSCNWRFAAVKARQSNLVVTVLFMRKVYSSLKNEIYHLKAKLCNYYPVTTRKRNQSRCPAWNKSSSIFFFTMLFLKPFSLQLCSSALAKGRVGCQQATTLLISQIMCFLVLQHGYFISAVSLQTTSLSHTHTHKHKEHRQWLTTAIYWAKPSSCPQQTQHNEMGSLEQRGHRATVMSVWQ